MFWLQNKVFPHPVIAIMLWLACGWLEAAPAASGRVVVSPEAELYRLTALALERNPQVVAARHEVERYVAVRDELKGFFDPKLKASGQGQQDGVAGQDGFLSTAGTEMALQPGAYLDLQAGQNYLNNLSSNYPDRTGQTMFTARLRVPLNRDRGFVTWKLDDQRAAVEARAARARLLDACQTVRREVDLRYVILCTAQASFEVAAAASRRAVKLLDETREMVRLKVVPEYQVYPAQYEVAVRRENEMAAVQAIGTASLRLAETLAAPVAVGTATEAVSGTPTVVVWAEEMSLPLAPPLTKALSARGNWRDVQGRADATRLEIRRNQEGLKSNVAVIVEGGWQGEEQAGMVGSGVYTFERNFGGLVGVTWSRPLGYQAERARVRQAAAHLAELEADGREVELAVKTDVETARRDYEQARERLRVLGDAVAAARLTLEAEEQRFRLGEGRSRNVLDAQKDLNEVVSRQTIVAGELLAAVARFHYATGYQYASVNGVLAQTTVPAEP
jgi:outer membrane protein TolC